MIAKILSKSKIYVRKRNWDLLITQQKNNSYNPVAINILVDNYRQEMYFGVNSTSSASKIQQIFASFCFNQHISGVYKEFFINMIAKNDVLTNYMISKYCV